jgi:hypothetical protein
LLATCPDAKVRDLPRAIEVARQAVAEASARLDREATGQAEKTLGLAYFRNGDWKNASAMLHSALGKMSRDDSSIRFLLLMASWHLGDRRSAREAYDSLARKMDEGHVQDVQLLPYRAEAAALLGVKDRALDPKPKTPPKDKR